MLYIRNLSKNFGDYPALKNISLEIPVGMYGLLGTNGAGKTTLMRILTTVLPFKCGEISMQNINWKQPHLVRNIVGYLPQKFSLYKDIKVREILYHIAVLKGLRHNKEKLVHEVLEKTNLSEYQNKKIGQLSGGMIRRIGIAQAILGNPPLLIVDEPTAGLDPEERIRFRSLLRHLSKDSIVLISTHIVEDIETTCENAAILHKGKILANGNINALANLAEGRVWSITVSLEEYFKMSENWNIISCKHVGGNYKLHILSDNKPDGAFPTEPSLEDGYLYLLGRVKNDEMQN